MKMLFRIFLFLLSFNLLGQYSSKDLSTSAFVDGTLLLPDGVERPPLAILIAGSGPTDRDGNSQMARNNSLKFLAEALASNGIAVFRYDKRILKQIRNRTLDEGSIRFSQFVEDAQGVVSYFYRADSFGPITIIGHSQGALVGLLACEPGVSGYVSLAGAGRPIDSVIVEQLSTQAPGLKDNARAAFDEIRLNGSTTNYSPGLESIFRPTVQPFMASWMQHDPTVLISQLNIPSLIVIGDKDLNVPLSEAELLKEAQPNAQLLVIPQMNHVLKKIEGNDYENGKSYSDPNLPVMPELVEGLSGFILELPRE